MTNGRPIQDCRLPWVSMVISPKGSVQPCCFASQQVGNISTHTVQEVWNGAKMVRLRGSILAGYVDPICKGASCHYVRDTEKEFGAKSYDYRYELDTNVVVCDAGEMRHCVSGWAEAHDWGVWSDGPEAVLRLDLVGTLRPRFCLHVLCRGAGSEISPVRTVRVLLNGHALSIWRFQYPNETNQAVWKVAPVPPDAMISRQVEIRFLIDEPVSPQLWGINYGRLIGIGLSGFKVTALEG